MSTEKSILLLRSVFVSVYHAYFRPFFSNLIRATFQRTCIYVRMYIASISHFECHRFEPGVANVSKIYSGVYRWFIRNVLFGSLPPPPPAVDFISHEGGSMFRACTGSPCFARQRSPWLMDINNTRHCCANKLQSFDVSDEMRIKDGNWCKRVCLCTCIYTHVHTEREREREKERERDRKRERIFSFKHIMLCSLRVAACSF